MSKKRAPIADMVQTASEAGTSPTENQVTIISYHRPIATMLDHVFANERWDANQPLVDRDLPYALSAVLLLVIWLEAACGRVRLLADPGTGCAAPAHAFLASLPSLADKKAQIIELFVIRDVIAHGHVRRMHYDYEGVESPIGSDQGLLPEYGDSKYRSCEVMEAELPVSKCLRLNLAATHVVRRDVLVVLSEVLDCLNRLSEADDLDGRWGEHTCRFRGRSSNLKEIQERLVHESRSQVGN